MFFFIFFVAVSKSRNMFKPEQLAGVQLKKTVIKVRQRDGSIYEERIPERGEELEVKYVGKEALPSFLQEGESGKKQLSSFAYVNDRWSRENEPREADSALHACLPSTLRVVTWNVWFKDYYLEQRAAALFHIISTLEPSADVICLQEVTPRFFELLLSQSWLRSRYRVSDSAAALTINPYGAVILSSLALAPAILEIHALPSNMGRRMVSARWPRDNFAIGTVHLESLDNTELRLEQLKLIDRALSSNSNAVLLGDMNFPDSAEENEFMAQHSWHDSASIALGVSASDRSFGRFDRIFTKTESGIALHQTDTPHYLGTQHIDAAAVHPSDHLGLTALIATRK